jgi:hypothetical protein
MIRMGANAALHASTFSWDNTAAATAGVSTGAPGLPQLIKSDPVCRDFGKQVVLRLEYGSSYEPQKTPSTTVLARRVTGRHAAVEEAGPFHSTSAMPPEPGLVCLAGLAPQGSRSASTIAVVQPDAENLVRSGNRAPIRSQANSGRCRTALRSCTTSLRRVTPSLSLSKGTSSTGSGNMINRLRTRSNSQLRTTDGAHSRANL